MVGVGAFVTTIAQPGVIGRLPLQLLLKTQLHFTAQTLAAFMVIATFAWNVKPLAGILSDAFPLFGTRRRHYMLLGAGMAAVCWFLMGIVPRTYLPLLLMAFGANAFMVIASTVMGGLMVEAGQKYGISGRVTSIRQALQSAVSLGNGILGGYLAAAAFGWTVGIATALLLVLAVTTFFVLTEPRVAVRDQDVLTNASHELATLVRSRTLWASGTFLALVYISPGFTTPLLFMQTDTLDFSAPYIGLMETIEGAAGLVGALIYGVVCRRFNLAAAPDDGDRAERDGDAPLPPVQSRHRAVHPRDRRLRGDLLGAGADGPGGPIDTAGMREPRVRSHDERAQFRARRIGRDRLVADRQPGLGLSRARLAQRRDDGADPLLHSAPATPRDEPQGRRRRSRPGWWHAACRTRACSRRLAA